MNGANRPVFNDAILPERKTRWDLFGFSFVVECIVVAALVVIPILMPQRMDQVRRYVITPMIEAPHISVFKPKPRLIPVARREVVREIPKPVPQPVVVPKPKFIDPVIAAPIQRRATARKNSPLPNVEVARLMDPNPVVTTGSSAIPTLRRPREAVQTGGFGDPDGVPTTTKIRQAPNINMSGSFDLPAGPGYGNGTGGAKGARGIVASSGFGNGVATGGNGRDNRGGVQQGGFSDAAAVPAAPVARKTQAVSSDKPVEVTYKPRPEYTAEAKANKIQGDVLLQVVFTASGSVQVQRVIRGLGYGLDVSAEQAARQIRFHPAERNGQAVDFPAVVHIEFALAY
ncbi:MAG TPA: energy transducer TonB [Candidatus Acidoferrum sp.]|nr:energy transducer TonB [Candidatus Acidoferrum sp.]